MADEREQYRSKEQYHLTDEDINQIVEKVCDKLEKRLYLNVGKGIVGFIWRGILILILAVAGYGISFHVFK